jgi:carboxylesterase
MDIMIGCLLIHGFTGSPYEVDPVTNHLANMGWRVEAPVLAGHLGDAQSLRYTKWHDWIWSAEVVLKDMLESCDRVYLVGFSMGGMIAAYLSVRYPVERLVLLNASLFYMNPQQLFKDFARVIKGRFSSNYYDQETIRRYMNKISKTPPRAVIHFRRLIKVVSEDLNRVNVPTLIIQGGKDDLVEPRSAYHIYQTIQSQDKEIHILPESKHIICHDCERQHVITLIDRFLHGE